MVIYNESKTSASSPVCSVYTQTHPIPEDYDGEINYSDRGNLSKENREFHHFPENRGLSGGGGIQLKNLKYKPLLPHFVGCDK